MVRCSVDLTDNDADACNLYGSKILISYCLTSCDLILHMNIVPVYTDHATKDQS